MRAGTEAERIAKGLGGKRAGSAWLACCPAHPDRNPSLRITQGYSRVLLHCYAGCEPSAIIGELKKRGILEGQRREMPATYQAAIDAHAPPARDDQDRKRKIEMAQLIWSQTEDLMFTPGEDYLRSRGIEMTRREVAVPYILDRVRWHPDCPVRRDTAPAVVAPVTNPVTGTVTGIWRVVLDEHGNKVERLGLGDCHGGAVRLDPALDDDEIAVTEGLEDGLAWMQATGSPAWATLSTSGMASVILPDRFRRVTIVADRDEWKERPNGTRYRPGLDAANKLAARLGGEGRKVRIMHPAAADCKDMNDVIRTGDRA